MRLRWTHGCQICSLKKSQKFRTQVWNMTETWIKLCLELNFIQDKGKKCAKISKISNSCKSACVINYSTEIQYLPPIAYRSWLTNACAKIFRRGLGSRKHCKLVLAYRTRRKTSNSRRLHLSEERYLERFSCLKFIIRFFILLGLTVI